jgi:transposase
MACELRANTWTLGFTTGPGHTPRERGVAARNQARGLQEVAQANQRFGLPESAPVVSCDEAGREGVWRHRFLQAQGLTNQVVDSSSIAVNRRQRRAKRAGLDVRKLLSLLRRFHHGDRAVGRVVHVPAVEAADQRHLHRDLERRKPERARTTPRIKGLLSRQGIRLGSLSQLPEHLAALRRWEGSPLPSGRRRRVLRVDAHHRVWREPMAAVEAERRAVLETSPEASLEKLRQLRPLKGIGIHGAWLWVREFLGWRAVKPRREVGGWAGFTPPPDQSGESAWEQGITKAGNRHGRWMMTAVAWSGLRSQPERAVRGWFRERFGGGGKRLRRIGMVAVARKLRMALWRFLQSGVFPEGAVLKEA